MTANIFTIAAGLPFADTLARGLIERFDAGNNPLALADVTIYLPTRRAVRTLGERFAYILGGAALLPQLVPLGDIDDDEAQFDLSQESLELLPAIAPLRRRLLLATLVERWERARDSRASDFGQAVLFARALAQFLDEAGTQEADLSVLEELAPAALAEHWADVRDFLVLLRDVWPTILMDENRLEPAARRRQLLDARAALYAASPPRGPVIAAGTTGSIPATARLLAAIAHLPNGSVILPGLDQSLDDESWNGLDPGHPQFGMKDLLGRIGIARSDVRAWSEPSRALQARAALLRETLRPAPTTDAWRAIADSSTQRATIASGLDGLSLIEAAHPGEEALVIALILRETLETPGRTAALVTPDRNLARRVSAEMGRWNIAIDDSAGKPLVSTPPGAFLLLLAEAVAENLAPMPLLALLKHPLAAGGVEPSEFRRMARALDNCLRGPRPNPGFTGLRSAVAHAEKDIAPALLSWLVGLEKILAPFCTALANRELSIPDIAEAHAEAAEALTASNTQSGEARLWQGEAGGSAAELIAALQSEAHDLPPIAPRSYLPLLRTLMEEKAVRPLYGLHPRLAILGPLEARLQSFDVVVLGGLNEGTWPAAAAADPWLSRPMREKLGLSPPERAIGLSAHDFSMLAAGARVYMTRSLKADGTPTVASRWLQRLLQLTTGLGLRAKLESEKPYIALAARLEQPGDYAPEPRPSPKPPVAKRPRTLSITEIETWLRDPYAIYARHILKLKPLDPLDAQVGPLERGTIIHRVLERFLKERAPETFDQAAARLVAIADEVFDDEAIPHAARAVWRPRLVKASRWFVQLEAERRGAITRSEMEIRGTLKFKTPAGEFLLRGRADRIDVLQSGGGAIIDYKTGNPPSTRQVREFLAPQLPLEGAILAAGGFDEPGQLTPQELIYIQFSGGAEAGKIVFLEDVPNLVSEVELRLRERISQFDSEDTAYLPRVMPYRSDSVGDYDHLSRVREWSVSGWQEDET
jgi:ATP-dependent helicase/nuclease subunit B